MKSLRLGEPELPQARPSASRRRFILACLLLTSATISCSKKIKRVDEQSSSYRRIVSLSPGVTQSVVALGAADRLVAVSDYCVVPKDRSWPRVGSAITPAYEAIAKARPDAILTSEVAGAQLRPLTKLAPTVVLPWLELSDVEQSLERLGQLLDRPEEGKKWSRRLHDKLTVSPPDDAPRVLWALDLGDTGSNETWFIRDNSLHGAVLRAAGGQNAITRPITGQPKLSAEELLTTDPDVILVVLADPNSTVDERRAKAQRLIRHFAQWRPLTAVRQNRIVVVHHPGAMDLGPGVIELVDVLGRALTESTASAPGTAEEAP